MSSAIQLRGLAWDHRRCWGPLEASVPAYRALQPDIQVAWNRRSLWEFGEGRLDGPAADYDLVIYDHPFVGEVARDGLMLDLMRFLSVDQIASFA
ncbi:MAG: ABC transporter substrate-binding protein, partial [Pseudomonadota bacterium]